MIFRGFDWFESVGLRSVRYKALFWVSSVEPVRLRRTHEVLVINRSQIKIRQLDHCNPPSVTRHLLYLFNQVFSINL